MPLTRSFGKTVADRLRDSPGFRAVPAEEADRVLADSDPETARWLLRCLSPPEPDAGPAEDAGKPNLGP